MVDIKMSYILNTVRLNINFRGFRCYYQTIKFSEPQEK
jgi:hypothetical protein